MEANNVQSLAASAKCRQVIPGGHVWERLDLLLAKDRQDRLRTRRIWWGGAAASLVILLWSGISVYQHADTVSPALHGQTELTYLDSDLYVNDPYLYTYAEMQQLRQAYDALRRK